MDELFLHALHGLPPNMTLSPQPLRFRETPGHLKNFMRSFLILSVISFAIFLYHSSNHKEILPLNHCFTTTALAQSCFTPRNNLNPTG
ncbi:hypothetical protein H5410_055524 [Solanum commersonii]|uniref:Uncharacterized protein n=1 Tax=Solanum commersonii TaxID=4109 RepID=A0A9J5WKJ0_SOLCO|nr:hypothetical protein H5410_055524 [Solanum commersonii]